MPHTIPAQPGWHGFITLINNSCYFCILFALRLYVAGAKICFWRRSHLCLFEFQVSIKDRKSIQNVKLARTGFILLGIFIMCWLPITVILTVTVAGDFYDSKFCLQTYFLYLHLLSNLNFS